MNTAKTVATAALVLAASAAQAQWYGEASYVRSRYKETDFGATFKSSPSALQLTGGYEAHPNLAVEAAIGLCLGDDEASVDGVNLGLEAKLHRMIGVYLKPKYALNDAFEVFGRIGYQKTTLRFSFDGDSGDESKSAAAYGLGASYHLDKNLYLSGSYMRYSSILKGAQLGVGYKF